MKLQKKNRRGQGMTEYIIIVAVIAILSLAVVMRFGNQIRNVFNASTDELAAGDGEVTKMDEVEGTKTSLSDL